MKKFILFVLVIAVILPLSQVASANSFTAPEVPESGSAYMPDSPDSFGEGLLYVLKSVIGQVYPSIAKAMRLSVAMIAITLLTSILNCLSSRMERTVQLAAAVGSGVLLIQATNTMVNLGLDTVTELSEYGKMLIPVMTAALAAQGGLGTSSALYTGTTIFISILTNLIYRLIVPLIYIFLCLSICNSAIGENVLNKLLTFVKWLITWILKTVLYVFTGYISITGVVSGTADSSMIKATKLTISGTVPVVGSILSDASESILISAGIMKNAAGVYGVLAIAAMFIYPFLQIGIHYLLMKLTTAICSIMGSKSHTALLQGFTTAMGFILAIICSISILLLIGIVCIMKGVT